MAHFTYYAWSTLLSDYHLVDFQGSGDMAGIHLLNFEVILNPKLLFCA